MGKMGNFSKPLLVIVELAAWAYSTHFVYYVERMGKMGKMGNFSKPLRVYYTYSRTLLFFFLD
jgi:hypothetical protein